MEKLIIYCGQQAKIGCDEKCNKAWGSIRPRIYPEISEMKVFGLNGESTYPGDEYDGKFDVDNYVLLSDDELGEAPKDNGFYEGGDSKPRLKLEIPNKWCARECERCAMSMPGEYNYPLNLKDFSKRRYNQPWKQK